MIMSRKTKGLNKNLSIQLCIGIFYSTYCKGLGDFPPLISVTFLIAYAIIFIFAIIIIGNNYYIFIMIFLYNYNHSLYLLIGRLVTQQSNFLLYFADILLFCHSIIFNIISLV